jgi:RsiW-degrading membrane proteinase PrsW (M82 family)
MVARAFLTALCTVLPVILLLRYFYTRDLHREPRAVLWKTFVLGILSILPAVLLGVILTIVKPGFSSIAWAALYEALVIAAIPEEALKLLVIRAYSARQRCFNEPMDGLVYGATAALGFAMLENAIYVLNGGWTVALMRAFTAVPMHAACGAILGNAVAQARFGPAKRGAVRKGFCSAVALHGLYDFGLIGIVMIANQPGEPEGTGAGAQVLALLALAAAVLIGAVIWTLRTVRRLRSQQMVGDRVSQRTTDAKATDDPSAHE